MVSNALGFGGAPEGRAERDAPVERLDEKMVTQYGQESSRKLNLNQDQVVTMRKSLERKMTQGLPPHNFDKAMDVIVHAWKSRFPNSDWIPIETSLHGVEVPERPDATVVLKVNMSSAEIMMGIKMNRNGTLDIAQSINVNTSEVNERQQEVLNWQMLCELQHQLQ